MHIHSFERARMDWEIEMYRGRKKERYIKIITLSISTIAIVLT